MPERFRGARGSLPVALAATLFLLAAAALLARIDATPLAGIRQLYFDHLQRLMPRDRSAVPVVVVAIDERSLQAQGQWPWRRDVLARLTGHLLAGQPLAVGFDVLFIEPDRFSPEELARQLPGLPPATLARVPDPDRQLAAALAAGPTVLALSGAPVAQAAARLPARGTPLATAAGGDSGALPLFPAALVSRPELEAAAAGQGLINAPPDLAGGEDERGVLRRVPLLGRIGDAVVPTLGLEMVRLALGAQAVAFSGTAAGVGDYRLPTLPDAQLLLHFGHSLGDRHISAADVLSGAASPDTWRGRLVIVGLTAQGLVDRVVTPLGEATYGADIHAQVIESLLAGDGLRRPPSMAGLELAALLLGGTLLTLAVPRLRPALAAALGAGTLAAAWLAGYAAFAAGDWLFDGASVAVLLNPLFLGLLGHTLMVADRRRRQVECDLQASREAAARDAGELDAARRIQMGLLPDLARDFAGDPRFGVAALLEPARAVGGDFYDCFALDGRRLCLVIGDVSGKGVPASLFMTVAKVLAGALARRSADPGEALSRVQEELERRNPEMMFVTVLAAVLDLEDGTLRYASAGHDAPLLRRGGDVTALDVAGVAGPPLCALPGHEFGTASARLAPGDLLCLFTDGATEARDGHGFFGRARLAAALAEASAERPEDCLQHLRAAVRRFEGGRPPADDLALLALRWRGPLSGP